MANRVISAGALAALVMAHFAGCSTMPVETRATVAEREEVLLEVPATWGRLLRSQHENVGWHGTVSLLLTPTTMYVIHPRGHEAISYALISHAAVRPVEEILFWPWGPKKVFEDQLVVTISRPTCWEGCVFNLQDGALARQVLAVIERQRPAVDPFGRRDGPRPVWLSNGSRHATYWWRPEPAYMQRTQPELKAALDRWFCQQTDCNGSGRTLPLYYAGLRGFLPTESGGGYSFRDLDGLKLNRRTELDTGALAKALRLADPAVDSLLVSSLTGIRLSEKVSADYRISVEVSFDTFLDYYDIDPLKDGQYFWDTYTVTKTAEEWLLLDEAGFAAEVALAARSVACRVQQELSAHGGAPADAACASGPPDHYEDSGPE